MAEDRTIKIEIKNLPQIKAAFARSPQLMFKELTKAIALTTTTIHKEEILNVSGTRGIRVVTTGLKGAVERGVSFGRLKATLWPNIEYAYWVHEGTKFMKARPFLERAVTDKQKSTDAYFEDAVQNVLNQIGKAT